MSDSTKVQENLNNEEIKQEDQKKISTLTDLREEFSRLLYIQFNYENFLSSKYYIVNCLNQNLEIYIGTLLKHVRFQSLLQNTYEGESQQNSQQKYNILLEEISKCTVINFNKLTGILSPKFDKKRTTIVINNVSTTKIEEFQQFIEKQCPLFEQTQTQVSVEEGQEPRTEINKNLKVQESTEKKVVIVGKDESVTQKCFQWLFTQTFDNNIKLNNIQMTEFNYYAAAYEKIFNTKPTNFKSVQPFPSPQQLMIQQQMMYQQQQQQLIMNQGHYKKHNYNRFNKNQQHNGRRNDQANGQNNNGQHQNNRNYNQNRNNRQNKRSYNNNGNQHQNPKNYNNRRQQPTVNVNDSQQFPGLG